MRHNVPAAWRLTRRMQVVLNTIPFVMFLTIGSMIQTFGTLKAELTKAVTALKAVQAFNVIFFQDEKARSLAGDGVILATPENKRKAFTFLDDTSAGGTTRSGALCPETSARMSCQVTRKPISREL